MGCAHTTANVRPPPTSISMTSKLPVRRQLNLNGLADNLERTLNLRNDKIYAKYAANFDGQQKPPSDPSAPAAETIKSKPPPAVIKPVRKTIPVSRPSALESTRLQPRQDHADSTAESSSDAEPTADANLPPPPQLDRITRRNWRTILAERDEHIDLLVARLDELHAHNIRFAADNRQLLRQQQRPRTPCSACSEHAQRSDRLGAELQQHSDHNATLTQDVHMLKTLVYRLNVQLERHQDELHRVGAVDDAPRCAGQTEAQPPPAAGQQQHWGAVNAHTLAPLLHAYTAMHAEQRELVAQCERDAVHFTGRLKDVLAENELLHTDLDRLRCSSDAWLGDRTRLQAQLDVCRHTADVQTQRADLAKQKLVEVLRCYEQKVQAQQLELERVQEAYARANGELQAMRGMQQNPEVVVESLRECQRLFEELKAQHDTERAKLVADGADGRRQCAAAEERWRAAADELDGVRRTLRERELDVSELMRKNAALRQSLGRVRLTREAFRTRLKNQTALAAATGGVPSQQQQQQSAGTTAADVELMVRERTHRVQTEVHARYVDEIERLSRKLQQRDDTLRRVLQTKVRPGGSGMAASQPAAMDADKPVTIL